MLPSLPLVYPRLRQPSHTLPVSKRVSPPPVVAPPMRQWYTNYFPVPGPLHKHRSSRPMATMAGLQNDPGIPFYRHLAGLGAGSLSPTSHYAPLSLEGPPTPCLSRRGSAGSMVSLGDMANSGHTDTAHQMRLTLEQTLLLERQFSETPKASVLVRRGLAEAIGLPVQRVTVRS